MKQLKIQLRLCIQIYGFPCLDSIFDMLFIIFKQVTIPLKFLLLKGNFMISADTPNGE